MIKIKELTDNLLKESVDYEDYSENICTLTIEEMRAEGLLKCGGCCSKGGGSKCNSCGSRGKCEGCKSKK